MAENTQDVNPLAKYFRQPLLYIDLPSKGKWYPTGGIELPVTGSIPVYAMTAKDEITLKTPDALLNGQSTVNVIQSCCPNIKDAWQMPVIDLDTTLIAIRIATYGKEMEFTSVCPHCGTKNEHAVDLTALLGNIKNADWESPTSLPGLEIYLKPQSFEEYNKNSLINYEEQRILQLVANEDMDENEKLVRFNQMFNKLVDTGISQIARSIKCIKLEDGNEVTNVNYISEFLTNCDKAVWEQLQQRINTLREQTQITIDTPCHSEECGKTYTTPFVFEQSSFFE